MNDMPDKIEKRLNTTKGQKTFNMQNKTSHT